MKEKLDNHGIQRMEELATTFEEFWTVYISSKDEDQQNRMFGAIEKMDLPFTVWEKLYPDFTSSKFKKLSMTNRIGKEITLSEWKSVYHLGDPAEREIALAAMAHLTTNSFKF